MLECEAVCPGRDSNPHSPYGPRDFKSLVSTISPPGPVPMNGFVTATSTAENNDASREEGILSEKRDSNPRPRPWQGRALPTELLSLEGCKYSGCDPQTDLPSFHRIGHDHRPIPQLYRIAG
jgi:hypothetical protein